MHFSKHDLYQCGLPVHTINSYADGEKKIMNFIYLIVWYLRLVAHRVF